MALASGWLMGDGKFAVTDLGAVAQPGAAKVTLGFPDGATASAEEFGLADPGLGLVLLRVGADAPVRPGIALAAQAPSPDRAGVIASAAWPWGRQLEMVVGRMVRGPSVKDIAARLRVEAPTNIDTFLRVDGARLDTVGGGPVVDNAGTVVAVRLDLAVRDFAVSLAVPAPSLRQSLVSAPPEVKPLADLPKPLWPVHLLRLKGEPVTPTEFSKTGQALKAAMVCQTCQGKKEIDLAARGGVLARLGVRAAVGGTIPCPVCGAEGITLAAGVYDKLVAWAEQGTRAYWSPAADDRSRALVRTSTTEILQAMVASGVRFRTLLALSATADLFGQGKSTPRGCVFLAQVRDTIEGADGRYLILGADNVQGTVAVRVDDVTATGKALAGGADDKPWVMVVGAILSRYSSDKYQGVAVLPLQWAPSAAFGAAAGPAAPPGMPAGMPGMPGPGPGGPPRPPRGG